MVGEWITILRGRARARTARVALCGEHDGRKGNKMVPLRCAGGSCGDSRDGACAVVVGEAFPCSAAPGGSSEMLNGRILVAVLLATTFAGWIDAQDAPSELARERRYALCKAIALTVPKGTPCSGCARYRRAPCESGPADSRASGRAGLRVRQAGDFQERRPLARSRRSIAFRAASAPLRHWMRISRLLMLSVEFNEFVLPEWQAHSRTHDCDPGPGQAGQFVSAAGEPSEKNGAGGMERLEKTAEGPSR